MHFRHTLINNLFLLLILLTGATTLQAQTSNPEYDKSLADSLGADNYGMKMYVLAILKTGPATKDKATSDSLFGGYMKNIKRLVEMGKLVVAGPLQKNEKNYRGIFILNVKTTEEAATLLETDPAIHAGLLAPELYGWYSSAALPMYLPASGKVGKENF